jgi:hypothetical protein
MNNKFETNNLKAISNGATTISITTRGIMAVSRVTLSIKNVTCRTTVIGKMIKCDSQHCSMLSAAIMLNVVVLNVTMLSVVALNVTMLSVVVLNVTMLSVVMMNVIMLNVIMLNVIMLNVIMLNELS